MKKTKIISIITILIFTLFISGCNHQQIKECEKCQECQKCDETINSSSNNTNDLEIYKQAAIIMDNYHLSTDEQYLDSLTDENAKNYLVFSKLFSTIDKFEYCKYLDNESNCNGEHVFYKSYDDALQIKKLLFGDNTTLEKSNFEYDESGTFFKYYYVPELDGFLEVIGYGGSGVLSGSYGEKILSTKIDGGKLKVKTYKYYLKPFDTENNETVYEIGTSPDNLFGIKINYEDVNSEVIKYVDNFEQYEYTFKRSYTSIQYLNNININKDYSLIEINKIK